MSNIVVRDVPEELHASLKKQAKRHHRSVTKEVVSLIEAGVRNAEGDAHAAPAQPAPDYAEILAAIRDGCFARFRSLEEVNAYVDELRQDRDDVAP
jgi:plasmid stability protein